MSFWSAVQHLHHHKYTLKCSKTKWVVSCCLLYRIAKYKWLAAFSPFPHHNSLRMSSMSVLWSINYKVESGFGKVTELINWQRTNALQPQSACLVRFLSREIIPQIFILAVYYSSSSKKVQPYGSTYNDVLEKDLSVSVACLSLMKQQQTTHKEDKIIAKHFHLYTVSRAEESFNISPIWQWG